jgi:HNH endonuclease
MLVAAAVVRLQRERCASACALAWLGGSPRFMGRAAHIGFHAAYIEREGQASESGVGNALVGSYLTQIGLSEAAVVYITQAAPTEITLLTLRDAEKIGIKVLPFEQQIPATKPDKRVTSRETSKQEIANRARLFVKEINSRYSRTNSVEFVPWSDCNDEQRLDVHNGLLLSALWDAAFDQGLVSFADNGAVLASPQLSKAARKALGVDAALPLRGLRDAHRANLRMHRARHKFSDRDDFFAGAGLL